MARGPHESAKDDGDAVDPESKNDDNMDETSSITDGLNIKDEIVDEDHAVLSPQSAASIKFFATPELCERPLLLLPTIDNLRARQASIVLRDTTHASPSLQRRLFLLPGELLCDPTDLLIFDPILVLQPFVFAARLGIAPSGEHKLFLTPRLLNYIDSYKTASLGTLGDMFITQPPLSSLAVYYTWIQPGLGEDQTIVEKWHLREQEGIKVKGLMRFIVEKKWGAPNAQIYQDWYRTNGEVAVVVSDAWQISRERI